MPFTLVIKEDRLRDLARALRSEEDGKDLRKQLLKNLRAAMAPARDAVRAELNGMSSHGGSHGMSLRREVSRKVVVEIRTAGRSTGVRLKAKKTPGVRDFRNAPKRLNSRKGWRHTVFGDRQWWVAQMGKPGWFDDPIKARRGEFRKAVADALDATADRIRQKVR